MTAFDNTSGAPAARDPLEFVLSSQDHDMPDLVRSALADGRCSLVFQPVFRTGGRGGIAFHEGLIRVTDTMGRILPAARFMSDVEATEIGRDLDAASLRLAFEALRAHPALRLSVNVSARSLGDTAWRRVLGEYLGRDDLSGERLILEISESSAMLLPEVVARFMAEMQPLGVAFALDAFGAGHTAFRHLGSFLFDLVKIHRGFVAGVADDADQQVLVGALLAVAHQFEMFAVANGVERAEDAAWLAAAGVDCLQGYHVGVPKPVPSG